MNVRILLAAALLGIACTLTSGCTLLVAGVVGVEIERQHRDWCQSINYYASDCWKYRQYRHR